MAGAISTKAADEIRAFVQHATAQRVPAQTIADTARRMLRSKAAGLTADEVDAQLRDILRPPSGAAHASKATREITYPVALARRGGVTL